MIGSQDTVNAVYGPYMDVFIEALEKTDFLRFSEELEALMIYEFRKQRVLCQSLVFRDGNHMDSQALCLEVKYPECEETDQQSVFFLCIFINN